jgi:hypothetical protein
MYSKKFYIQNTEFIIKNDQLKNLCLYFKE